MTTMTRTATIELSGNPIPDIVKGFSIVGYASAYLPDLRHAPEFKVTLVNTGFHPPTTKIGILCGFRYAEA